MNAGREWKIQRHFLRVLVNMNPCATTGSRRSPLSKCPCFSRCQTSSLAKGAISKGLRNGGWDQRNPINCMPVRRSGRRAPANNVQSCASPACAFGSRWPERRVRFPPVYRRISHNGDRTSTSVDGAKPTYMMDTVCETKRARAESAMLVSCRRLMVLLRGFDRAIQRTEAAGVSQDTFLAARRGASRALTLELPPGREVPPGSMRSWILPKARKRQEPQLFALTLEILGGSPHVKSAAHREES